MCGRHNQALVDRGEANAGPLLADGPGAGARPYSALDHGDDRPHRWRDRLHRRHRGEGAPRVVGRPEWSAARRGADDTDDIGGADDTEKHSADDHDQPAHDADDGPVHHHDQPTHDDHDQPAHDDHDPTGGDVGRDVQVGTATVTRSTPARAA